MSATALPEPSLWPAPRIAEFLARTFVHPDQVVELRALNVGRPGRTVGGYFDGRHLLDLARTALAISRQATAVFFTPNPVDPGLLSRCPNRTDVVSRDKFPLARDADFLERRFLFVDIDPVRGDGFPQDSPSSDEELAFARDDAARVVIAELAELGWRRPVRLMSGNGVHLLFPLAEPIPATACEYEGDPLRECLDLFRDWHFRSWVKIDPNTWNATRLLKVPGTRVAKGTETPGRPYRTADVLEIPDDWPAPRRPEPRCTDGQPAGQPRPVGPPSARGPADHRAQAGDAKPVGPAARPRGDEASASGGPGGKSAGTGSSLDRPKGRRPRRSRAEGRGLFG